MAEATIVLIRDVIRFPWTRSAARKMSNALQRDITADTEVPFPRASGFESVDELLLFGFRSFVILRDRLQTLPELISANMRASLTSFWEHGTQLPRALSDIQSERAEEAMDSDQESAILDEHADLENAEAILMSEEYSMDELMHLAENVIAIDLKCFRCQVLNSSIILQLRGILPTRIKIRRPGKSRVQSNFFRGRISIAPRNSIFFEGTLMLSTYFRKLPRDGRLFATGNW